MTDNEILERLRDCGALLSGHFLLSSGAHSAEYVQCAKALQYPGVAEELCRHMASFWRESEVDVVIGPAMGAVTLAYELARALNARGLFAERIDGKMTLRRGFTLGRDEGVLVVEDVLTTGGSAAEVIDQIVKPSDAQLVGLAAIIDRGGAPRFADMECHTLLKLDIPVYQPDACPLCKEGSPAVKPGSRADRPG